VLDRNKAILFTLVAGLVGYTLGAAVMIHLGQLGAGCGL
jgi:hypothetical protein